MATIGKDSFKFLKDLKNNNNREWFGEHKDRYTHTQVEAKEFLTAIEAGLNKFDVIEKKKLFRIYRDVRFSKDKTPYSTSIRMSLAREGQHRRGGYFIKIEPKGTMVGGGFYNPNSSDIKLIRSHIAADDKPIRKILNSKKFKKTFGQLMGQQLKTAPKGYPKDHPSIDLLKYKSMYVFHTFSDKEVLSHDFAKNVIKVYKDIQPFFEYMTDILTHDLDGIPMYS